MKHKLLFKNVEGQTIVEFALIIPILILLVFGIIDFGRLFYSKSLMNNVAKETLRTISLGSDINTITQQMERSVQPLAGNVTTSVTTDTDDEGNSCTKITLTPTDGYSMVAYISPTYENTLVTGNTIRVCVVYKVDYITPLASMMGSSKELKIIYYSRIEQPPS